MLVSFEDINKRFGPTLALNDVSAKLTGRVNLFLGANGSGKSTLLNILAGIAYADDGTLAIDGDVCSAKDKKSWRHMLENTRKKMGFLLEKPGYPAYMTGIELLLWESSSVDRESKAWVKTLIDDLGMSSYVHRTLSHYSSGMMQKLGIAASLVSRPEIVLWDEPTANLDATSRTEVAGLVRQLVNRGTSFIIASHTPADFEGLADWVGLMRLGELLRSGSLSALSGESETYTAETDRPSALAAELFESEKVSGARVEGNRVAFEASESFDVDELRSIAKTSGISLSSLSKRPKTVIELYLDALADWETKGNNT